MSSKTGETTEGGLPASGALAESARGAGSLAGLPHIVLKPEAAGVQLNLGDLWAYRELLYFLTWRDI